MDVDTEIRKATIAGGRKCIAKILNASDEKYCDGRTYMDYTYRDLVKNEMIISKHMSDIGIGPHIYDMALTDKQGIIIMDKFDGKLIELMEMYYYDRTIYMTEILKKVETMMNKMHDYGIIHNDIKSCNIMYKNNGEIVLMDWGKSVYSTSEELRNYDRAELNAIRDLYNKINDGYAFEDPDYLYEEVISPPQPEITVNINGEKCEYWWEW